MTPVIMSSMTEGKLSLILLRKIYCLKKYIILHTYIGFIIPRMSEEK